MLKRAGHPHANQQAIRAFLTSRKRLETPARTALMLGLLTCGIFGMKLVSNNKEGRRRYICRKDTVTGHACGGIYIISDLEEDFIVQAVRTRLNSQENERSFSQVKPDSRARHSRRTFVPG